MKKRALLTLAAIILTISSQSQETPEKFSAGGYASWLHNAMFEYPSDIWINSSMLHNRLNFKAYPGSRTTITLEVRNRLITGDLLLADPSYASSIGYDQGWVDMSWNIIDEQSVILNTFIDRASVDFTAGTLQVSAGRQRINWSQALVWNPNDIFNTYSYFDFDYVERPGSDAVRVIWSPGASSSAEIAVKADNTGAVTAAALWRFSIPYADLQFLAGESEGDMITLGTGWSANAGSYSLRGEATWFLPFGDAPSEEGTVIATAGVDRVFSDKFTAITQFMYSSNPVAIDSFRDFYRGGLTARSLAFSEFTLMGQVTYTPMPLLNLSLSAIWYPDLKGYYAGPSVDFSLAENVDFSLVWQYFESVVSGDETQINMGFLRIKYSF